MSPQLRSVSGSLDYRSGRWSSRRHYALCSKTQLKTAGHQNSDPRKRGSREWFVTNETLLDEIASALELETIYSRAWDWAKSGPKRRIQTPLVRQYV